MALDGIVVRVGEGHPRRWVLVEIVKVVGQVRPGHQMEGMELHRLSPCAGYQPRVAREIRVKCAIGMIRTATAPPPGGKNLSRSVDPDSQLDKGKSSRCLEAGRGALNAAAIGAIS